MREYNAEIHPYNVIKMKSGIQPYPLLRCDIPHQGCERIYCISPIHGRSYMVATTSDDRYVISKGNGLSYTRHQFLNTGEMGADTWGLLLKRDALRDYLLGEEIAGLQILTNKMEAVLQLDYELLLPNKEIVKPVLLQYSVECPFRISDAPFMRKKQIENEVYKWEKYNRGNFTSYHMIAADVLIKNLRIMHDNQILHNAIHEQNYTWALELLDFELSCSPKYPYENEDYQRHVKSLYSREIVQTYQIIQYIAGVLNEYTSFEEIDELLSSYGFELNNFIIY